MSESVNLVDRIFVILEYLSLATEPKGPTDIAQATGLHKSTVHRLLTAMNDRGYVERDKNGTYRIGVKLVEIASNHINNLELHAEARPFLNEIREELGLSVYLGILDNREVVYVEKLDSGRNLRLYTQIGLRVPAYCSSLGKCLLANMSGDDLDYLLYGVTLDKFTENTITSKKQLKTHLREVRKQGWAMDNEEYIVGNRCVAAPIFDYRGEAIAAVSVSGPASVFDDEKKLAQVVKRTKETAAKISRQLCYR